MTKKNKNKFNAEFSPISHISRATIQKEEGYDHFLDTNYYNPCRTDIWNVVCITFDVKTPSNSLLWVNQGKICNFTCHTPMRDCSINFYNNAVPTHASGFNGFVIGLNWIEGPEGDQGLPGIEGSMKVLCIRSLC